MKTGRRQVLAGMLGVVVAGALPALPARSAVGTVLKLDFGASATTDAPGYRRVLTTDLVTNTTTPANSMSESRPWGWVTNTGLQARDRNINLPANTPAPNPPVPPLLKDFIFASYTPAPKPPATTPAASSAPRVFRLGFLTPGRYRLTFFTGDHFFGDHDTRIVVSPGVEGTNGNLVLAPFTAQYSTMTCTVVVPSGSSTINITFDTTGTTWVINSLVLEQLIDTGAEPVRVTEAPTPASLWPATPDDPTLALLDGHRARVAANSGLPFQATGLSKADYLSLIISEVDFWKTNQNPATGAIIDPYLSAEFQYSTPAFALAAATAVVYGGRSDLLESAALALDWSVRSLSLRRAASQHEDFFAPMIAHSIRLLKPLAAVDPARSAAWEFSIWNFEPFITYRYDEGVNNWNVVAACGEAFFQMMGIRNPSHTFVEASFARQGDNFDSTYGLYLEEALAYDHFPRLWVADLLKRGYSGPYSDKLSETLRRASITSLFMQSPTGELPSGGRSAHHQWNEAAECVTFEIYAARALENGDYDLAAYFKRAAHLALGAMRRWIRPTGELQIVKNWMDPSQKFGYETYSAHSQYNLLPMAMLSMAYEHAGATEGLSELPSPADVGGFVFEFQKLNKVFANAGGAYVEVDTTGDHDATDGNHNYDATGLIRAHFTGHVPQAGLSDSLLSKPKYVVPTGGASPITTCAGVSWQGTDNIWRHQGEQSPVTGSLPAGKITSVVVTPTLTTAALVKFTVTYNGNFGGGVTSIVEEYELAAGGGTTPSSVQVKTTLPGFSGPVRRTLPILSDDGKIKSKFLQSSEVIKITQPGMDAAGKYIFRFTGASSLSFPTTQYANHNGWARLATAEYAPGAGQTGVTLRIEALLV